MVHQVSVDQVRADIRALCEQPFIVPRVPRGMRRFKDVALDLTTPDLPTAESYHPIFLVVFEGNAVLVYDAFIGTRVHLRRGHEVIASVTLEHIWSGHLGVLFESPIPSGEDYYIDFDPDSDVLVQ